MGPSSKEEAFDSLVEALNNLAENLHAVGRCDDSLTALQRAANLATQRPQGGATNSKDNLRHLVYIAHNRSAALRRLERFDEALASAQESLALSEQCYGRSSREVAYSLNNLGAIFSSLNDLEREMDSYQRSAALFKKARLAAHSGVRGAPGVHGAGCSRKGAAREGAVDVRVEPGHPPQSAPPSPPRCCDVVFFYSHSKCSHG